jgi:hypothetical protein
LELTPSSLIVFNPFCPVGEANMSNGLMAIAEPVASKLFFINERREWSFMS